MGYRTSPEHPPLCFQDAQPHSGLLQASLITLYTIYVTWSALANVPSKEDVALGSGGRCMGHGHTLGWVLCPPGSLEKGAEPLVCLPSAPTCNPTLLVRNSTVSAMATQPVTTWWDAPSIVGLIIFILCTLFIR